MLGSAESEVVRLISREISSQNSNLYDHDTSTLQTDRQTNNLPWRNRATHSFAVKSKLPQPRFTSGNWLIGKVQ